MKATGIVRRIDDLGRVVIPKELRRTMGIAEGDPMEIFIDEDKVILRKYTPGCYLCESQDDLKSFHGKMVCNNCITEIVQHYSTN